MSSADLLRRAAQKLREAAEKASKGPWDAADDGLVWPDRLGDPVSGSTEIEDAAFIALMHPPVALALAELLDRIACDMEEADAWISADDGFVRDEHGTVRTAWTASADLARAILREEAS